MSEIATFHTTKIIMADPSKFHFIGTIPESMYQCASMANILINEYKKLPAIGRRPLTPKMQKSLDVVDKQAKRGKKRDAKKEVQQGESSKPVTPKKRKGSKAESLAPKKRKLKKMAHKPKSPSSSDSEYVPSGHDDVVEHEKDKSQLEYLAHKDSSKVTHSNTVPSPAPSPPRTTIPITIAPCPHSTSSSTPTSTPLTPPIFTQTTTTTTTTEPPVHVNASDVGA